MNNAARPLVREQFSPRALAIIERYQRVQEGYDKDGAPLYTGIDLYTWKQLEADPDFNELYGILTSDFPTYCAVNLKIYAKRIGRLMPFIFNRTQRILWNRMAWRMAHLLSLFIVILKARQLGASTLVNAFAHWDTWRLHDIEVTLIVHEKPLAYSFVDRLRIFHEELPHVALIQRTLRQASKTARVPRDELFYNETRSKITTVVAKKAEARGRSSPHYHLAEYAFYPEAGALLGAILPQMPAIGTSARLSCSFIVESTPNGKNDFYRLWQHANDSASEWDPQFYPWFVAEDEYSLQPPPDWVCSPERRAWGNRLAGRRLLIDGCNYITDAQLYWYEATLESECEGDQDVMDREYPSDAETCFLLRSRSIFKDNMRYLQACVDEAEANCSAEWKKRGVAFEGRFARGTLEFKVPDNPFGNRAPTYEELTLNPKFVFDGKGPLWIWSPPQPGHEYAIGIDVAAGTFAGDWSYAHVGDLTTGKQVAELWYKCSPEQLTDDSVALGYFYNTAILYPEINSIGSVVMKRAKQIWHYPRVGREEKWDEVGLKDKKYGHYTTYEGKQIMVSFLKHIVQEQYYAIASQRLLGEMSTFIETASGEFEADSGAHDDCVMGTCLFGAVVRQSPRMLADLSSKKHRIKDPNAMTSMIYDAPVLEKENPIRAAQGPSEKQRVPKEVQALLDGQSIMGIPANPISSGIDIPLPY